jgi:biotin carboxyl carrier protein
MKYTVVIQEQRLEIELRRKGDSMIEAEIGGRLYQLQGKAVEPGIYWLTWNNQSLEIGVTQSIDGYVVSMPGRRIAVAVSDARNARRRAAQQSHDGIGHIRAPMPGKVIKLLVAEGTEVQANQGVVVLEAMKMQNEIKSPKKGIVRKLGVTEGSAVNSGDLLATVE